MKAVSILTIFVFLTVGSLCFAADSYAQARGQEWTADKSSSKAKPSSPGDSKGDGGRPGKPGKPGGKPGIGKPGGGKPGGGRPGGGKPGSSRPDSYKPYHPSVTPSDHRQLSYGATPTDSLRYGVVPDPWKDDSKRRPEKRRRNRDRNTVYYHNDYYYNDYYNPGYYVEPEEDWTPPAPPEPETYFTPGPFEPFDDPRFPK